MRNFSPPVEIRLAEAHHEQRHLECGQDQQHLEKNRDEIKQKITRALGLRLISFLFLII